MRFGPNAKYPGKIYQEVFLKYPDYAKWYIANYENSPSAMEFNRLIDVLNKKPFTANCYSCKSPATRATAYQNSATGLHFWCDNCDPYGAGANRGKLYEVRTFWDAVQHIELNCSSTRTGLRQIVKELARGKGLPGRVTESVAAKFLP